MAETTITPVSNGPYLVQGPVQIVDAAGHAWKTEAGKAVALCRCGQSANKPFCDGSHKTTGFSADTKAPA